MTNLVNNSAPHGARRRGPSSTKAEVEFSYLPGAYLIDDKLKELLTEWDFSELASGSRPQYKLPEFVFNGCDYGPDQDSFAAAASYNRAAGQAVTQRVVSVEPFDANGLGWFAARDAKESGKEGTLYILNSAPGRNVSNGTTNNRRERFFGARLKNGAIVVGTTSDQLADYFSDLAEVVVDLPLWDSGSQARGIDVFPVIAHAFYQVASRPDFADNTRSLQTIQLGSLVEEREPKIVLDQTVVPHDNVTRYVYSSSDLHLPSAFAHVPVPSNDLRAAAYSAFRIANGGQPHRETGDPRHPRSTHVILEGFDSDRDKQQEVWFQVQRDGSVVLGAARPEVWQFSPADQKVRRLGKVSISELPTTADALLSYIGLKSNVLDQYESVPDSEIAIDVSKTGPLVTGRVDHFGNWDIAKLEPGLLRAGQVVEFNVGGVSHRFVVRDHLFDAQTAKDPKEPIRPECTGFSLQASGGGWLVRTKDGEDGPVQQVPLSISQAYTRTSTPEIPSAMHAFGAKRRPNGVFEVPRIEGISIKDHLLNLSGGLSVDERNSGAAIA